MPQPVLPVPAFADFAKPITEVFVGSARAGGAFAPQGESKVSLSAVTADGIILSAQALAAPGAAASTTLSLIHAPARGATLSLTLGSGGAASAGVTLAPAAAPGLTASLQGDPFAAAKALGGAAAGGGAAAAAAAAALKGSIDYAPPGGAAHFRAAAGGAGGGVDVSAAFVAGSPALVVGGSATVGGAGARGGGAGTPGVAGWAVGAAWSRVVGGKGGNARQQLTATLTDAGAAPGGRSLNLMAAQQVGGAGRTTLALDCLVPLDGPAAKKAAQQGALNSTAVGSVALAVSHRLDSGGLLKAKVSHGGALSFLYEARAKEGVRLGATLQVDPASGYAPRLGLSADLSP